MKNKFLLLPFLLFLFTGNSFSQTKIAYVRSFSSFPYAFMFDNNDEAKDFIFVLYDDIQKAAEDVVNRKADAVILSVNAASSLYDFSKGRIVCACVLQNTDFYGITNSQSKKNLSDLLGKRVSCSAGGIQKSLLSWILKENDLPIGKGNGGISMIWKDLPFMEYSCFYSGESDFAFLSEPLLSNVLKNSKNMQIAIDIQDEYNVLRGRIVNLPKSLLVVNRSYSKSQFSDLEKLLNALKNSVEKMNTNPSKASYLAKKNKLCMDTINLSNSIRRANFCFQSASESENEIKEILKIHASFNPSFNSDLEDDFFLSN